MSKILFRTIKIRVPEDFVVVDAKGNLTIKHTLTKKKMPSRVKGEPSIDLIPDDKIDHAEIINNGELLTDVKEKKLTRKYTKKVKQAFQTEVMPDIKPAQTYRKFISKNKYPRDTKLDVF